MATIKTKGMIQAVTSQSPMPAGVDTCGGRNYSDIFEFTASGNGSVTLTCGAAAFAIASTPDANNGNIAGEGHGHVTLKRGAKSHTYSGDLASLDLAALVASLRAEAEAAPAGVGGMDANASYGYVANVAQNFVLTLSGNIAAFRFVGIVEQNEPAL